MKTKKNIMSVKSEAYNSLGFFDNQFFLLPKVMQNLIVSKFPDELLNNVNIIDYLQPRLRIV